MAKADSPADAVLQALGLTLFLREGDGTLLLQGAPPDWLHTLWPGLTKSGDPLPLEQASPFLENFLIDAADCWSSGGQARIQSGAWVEAGGDGAEISLEATALTIDGQAALLLERLGEVFEAKKSILQKARETVIAYQRLNSETQKKEILLSCIAEEMNAALANAITSLRLIELEKNSPRTRQLLTLAMRATEDQQALINKVLTVFAAELESLYGSAAEASLGEVVRDVAETVAAAFAEKTVRLRLPEKVTNRVAMDAEHLARVLVSLLENGLHNAPPGSEVALEITEEGEAVVLRVRDSGPTLPNDASADFFAKGSAAKMDGKAAWQLRLQFCRMAVEKCHGEIGSEAPAAGGNCFWIRLPKPASRET
jgi:K+-sensing histidine kinase KdpD